MGRNRGGIDIDYHYGDNVTLFEAILLGIILLICAGAGGYLLRDRNATKDELQHEREKRVLLEKRIAALEDADKANYPGGYNFQQVCDELIALNVGSQERARVEIEILKALKRGNFRGQHE